MKKKRECAQGGSNPRSFILKATKHGRKAKGLRRRIKFSTSLSMFSGRGKEEIEQYFEIFLGAALESRSTLRVLNI